MNATNMNATTVIALRAIARKWSLSAEAAKPHHGADTSHIGRADALRGCSTEIEELCAAIELDAERSASGEKT